MNRDVGASVIIPTRKKASGDEKAMWRVGGRPMLSYAIEAAQEAQSTGRVCVVTNGADATVLAQELGAATLRLPDELNGETTPAFASIAWAFGQFAEQFRTEKILITRATSPLRRAKHIDEAFAALNSIRGADSLASVTESVGAHPTRLRFIRERLLEEVSPGEEGKPTRRQSVEPVYLRNGAIYITTPALIGRDCLWGPRCAAYVMDSIAGFNVNTETDLLLAECLLQREMKSSV